MVVEVEVVVLAGVVASTAAAEAPMRIVCNCCCYYCCLNHCLFVKEKLNPLLRRLLSLSLQPQLCSYKLSLELTKY